MARERWPGRDAHRCRCRCRCRLRGDCAPRSRSAPGFRTTVGPAANFLHRARGRRSGPSRMSDRRALRVVRFAFREVVASRSRLIGVACSWATGQAAGTDRPVSSSSAQLGARVRERVGWVRCAPRPSKRFGGSERGTPGASVVGSRHAWRPPPSPGAGPVLGSTWGRRLRRARRAAVAPAARRRARPGVLQRPLRLAEPAAVRPSSRPTR